MSPRYKGMYESDGDRASRYPQHRANVDVTNQKKTSPPFDIQTDDLLPDRLEATRSCEEACSSISRPFILLIVVWWRR
jgi:hypothetical protein